MPINGATSFALMFVLSLASYISFINTGNENANESSGNGVPARRMEKFIFQSEMDAAGKKTIPIYLIGDKQALFVYPNDITEDDIELVKHQIEGVLLRIKLEAKKNVQKNEKRDESPT